MTVLECAPLHGLRSRVLAKCRIRRPCGEPDRNRGTV